MSPTPISILDNSLTPVMYRNAWETGQSDPLPRKLVGGHLPLSKRNSTPVGMGIGVNPHYPSLKMNISQQNHQLLPVPQVVNPAPASDILTSTHRPLDRCHSEPVGPSQSVTGAGTASSRYKTELCRPYAETGFCKYGEKCQFAHGDPELRGLPRHPKYKTELCRTFHTTGLCGYGTRCHFIHNADERQHGAPMQQGPCLTGDEPPFLLLQQQQQQSLSPPASLHGSPRSSGGAFFGDSFCTSPFAIPFEDTTTTASSPFPLLGLDTPPVSPVESLAGDIENLSLSPSLSDSPPPGLCSAIGGHLTTSSSSTAAAAGAIMDPQRYLRLPIFQSLKEAL